MLTEDRLREILGRVPGATQVIVGRRGTSSSRSSSLPSTPTSRRSSGSRRQWGLVLDNLSDAKAAQVSFVYANTPEEKAQAELDAAAERRDG